MLKKLIILTMFLLPIIIHAKTIEICHNETISEIENECKANLIILTDKEEYNNKEKITILNNLSLKSNYIIEYWAEDSNKTIIKAKRNTTNIDPKSYTPNLDYSDKIKIISRIVNLECNETSNITYAEKEVFVYFSRIEETFVKLTKKSKDILNLNETLKIKLDLYTGNFSNEIVEYNFLNKTGYESILNPYSPYNLSINIQIPNDCSIISNNYTLKINLLKRELMENIQIINNCKYQENNSTSNETLSIQNLEEELHSESNINISENQITGNTVYESSSNKSKKFVIYFILGLALMGLLYIFPLKHIAEKQHDIQH